MIFHESAEEFLGIVRAPLRTSDAENSLLLGSAEALVKRPPPDEPPVLASLVDGHTLRGALIRVPPRPCVVAASDAAAAGRMAEALFARDRRCPGVVAPTPIARPFAEAWTAISGSSHALIMENVLYELTEVTFPERPPGAMRQAGPADEDLVGAWIHAFSAEAVPHERGSRRSATATAGTRIRDGEIYLWESAGGASAMAGFARETQTSLSINAVYTPPEYRHRGCASALVAEMSALALEQGKRRCVLYADGTNPASNRLYRRIGYRRAGASQYFAFADV